MSVNPTKKTPDAGGRGREGRGRGGRGRGKVLPILDHAAVGQDDVEPRSPSSSPQVSPTRSRSGREKSGITAIACIDEKEGQEGQHACR